MSRICDSAWQTFVSFSQIRDAERRPNDSDSEARDSELKFRVSEGPVSDSV